MSAHPKEETLMDLAEGGGSPAARQHVARCASCTARLAEVRATAELARGVDVPEPPAMFWSAFQHDVRRRIADERPRAAWRAWWFPLTAVPLAAALALVVYRPPSWEQAPEAPVVPALASARPLPAWSPLPPAEEDDGMPVLEGLAVSGSVDWDEGRGLGAYLAGLSEEDSAALARALRDGSGEGVL